jgi:hypothetical protein
MPASLSRLQPDRSPVQGALTKFRSEKWKIFKKIRAGTQCRPEWYMSCFAFRDMGESYHVLKTALRVISAINEKRGSDPADIERLKAIAGPKPNDVTTDEFTCDVIKKAIDEGGGVHDY